jgi:uncharacterized protein (TIGR03000 family)
MKQWWLALVGVVVLVVPAQAGLFDRGPGPWMAYGPYTGGHAYSYNTAYSYGFAFSAADTWRIDPIAYPAGIYPPTNYGQRIYYHVFPQKQPAVSDISVPGEDGLPALMHPGLPPTSLGVPPAPVPVPGPLPNLQVVPAVATQGPPATIRVVVPYNAELWVEKEKTNQTGMERTFTLPPMTPGKLYVVNLRATWVENGKTVEQFRVVGIKAGETAKVNFLTRR